MVRERYEELNREQMCGKISLETDDLFVMSLIVHIKEHREPDLLIAEKTPQRTPQKALKASNSEMSHGTYRKRNEAVRFIDRKYVKSYGNHGKCAVSSCYRVTEKMVKAEAFQRFVCEHCMLGPRVDEERDEAEETRMSDAKLTCPAEKCLALSSPLQFINGECCEDAKKHQRKALVIDHHRAYLEARLEEDEAALELFDAEKRISSAKMKLKRAEEELKDAQKEVNSTKRNILSRRQVTEAKRRKLDKEAAKVCQEEYGDFEVRAFGPEDIEKYEQEDKSKWAHFK